MTSPAPANPNLQPARWRFGDSELDEFRLEILHLGEVVPLEAKALELLRQFVRHPGEVLTKDELMEAVWPGRVLSESVLARAISLLRKALGDSSQTLIRTVHGYGYRFDAPVERLTPVKTQSAPTLHLQAGQNPPLRPNWQLVERLGEGRNETWLAVHDKTRERRVFKFAGDGIGLSTLKREITLQRLLIESLGDQAAVVPVLDWNLQEAPYFIETEWCSGGSLERWLATNAQAPVETRIDLVAQAAEALAAAHAVGVLHKDVKPQNLLIVEAGSEPQVRLADFGSGLLIDDTRLQSLSITRLGLTRSDDEASSGSGSLLYLAPEVVTGQPATLKSDVYALGVLLFQLIVGDLRRPLAPGWERDVTDPLLREDIAAAAELDPAHRLADAAALAQRLRGLDERRAQRAAEEAARVQAEYAQQQLDRLQARRGWQMAAVGILAIGLAVSTWLYLDARRARDQARLAQAETAAVNDFLQHDLLEAADPRGNDRSDISVREVVEAAARRIDSGMEQPQLEARVRMSLGTVFVGLAQFEQAITQFRSALTLLPADALKTRWEAQVQLADAMSQLDRYEESRALYREALAEVERAKMPELAFETRVYLAEFERVLGHAEDGLAQLDALAPELAHIDPDSDAALRYAVIRGDLLGELNRPEAVEVYRAALPRFERVKGRYANNTTNLRRNLGGALATQGQDAEAVAILAPLYVDMQRIYGPTHMETLATINQLTLALQHLGQLDRAIELQSFAIQALVERYGEQNSHAMQQRANLATMYANKGDHDAALVLYRAIYTTQKAVLGEDRRETLTTAHNIARSLQDLGRWSEALEMQKPMSALAHRALGDEHFLPWAIDLAMARSQAMLAQYPEAQALLSKASERLESLLGADHRYVQRAHEYALEIEQRKAQGLSAVKP